MAGYDFPTDLIDAARRFRAVTVELGALERPRFVVDYPPGVVEAEVRLREEARGLAERIVTHHHWESYAGPDRVAARSALKQAAKSGAVPSGAA